MTQPVQFRQSLLIALLTGAQAVLPAIVAVAALYVTIIAFGSQFDLRSSGIVVVAVVCLVLIQPPREVTAQLTSPRVSAVVDVLFRWFLILAVLLGIAYVTKSPLQSYPRRVFLTWAVCTPMVLIVATLAMQEFMRRFLMNAFEARIAIIAGYNGSSLELARRLKKNPGMRLEVAGFFDDRSTDRLGMESDAKLIGPLADLGAYVKQHRTDVIFIALPIRHVKRVMNLLDDLRDTTASIYYVPDIFVFDLIQARSGEIQGIPVVAMCETPFYGYRGVAKRLTDIVLSVVILLLLLPLLAVVAVMVKVIFPGPRHLQAAPLRSRRPRDRGLQIPHHDGDRGRRADPPGIEDATIASRAIGGILRRSSLDELPQLINVLQGRMSLVGPRPHAVAHNEEYRKLIKGYMVRHKVLPGITGLAQVNGCRGETSQLEEMEARVNYDLDYLRRWTPMLDIKIILLTVVKIFRDDKAY